ncbi:MAG: alpha/beta hydrolase [Planctomycetes bacterium]|nr:alpha/beta hydrolase [Planctomycetota bacterium]
MEKDKDKHNILLIHGTFSSKEVWEDVFIPQLKDNIHDKVNIINWEWNGKNSFEDRYNASNELATFINTNLAKKPVLLIGHSHGGSVAAKALEFVNDPDCIHGLATLNTPFITPLKRDLKSGAKMWATYISTFVFMILVNISATLIIITQGNYIVAFAALIAWCAAPLYIYNSFWKRIYLKAKRSLSKEEKNQIRLSQIKENQFPVYCISTGGDEARSFLDAINALCNLPFWLLHKYSIKFFLSLSVLLPIVIFLYNYDYSSYSLWHILNAIPVFALLMAIACPLAICIGAALLGGFTVFILFILSFFNSSKFGFGRNTILGNIAVNLRSSPIPFNLPCHKYEEFDSVTNLKHSSSHRDGYVINKITDWICSKFHLEFTTNSSHISDSPNDDTQRNPVSRYGCILLPIIFFIGILGASLENMSPKREEWPLKDNTYFDNNTKLSFSLPNDLLRFTYPSDAFRSNHKRFAGSWIQHPTNETKHRAIIKWTANEINDTGNHTLAIFKQEILHDLNTLPHEINPTHINIHGTDMVKVRIDSPSPQIMLLMVRKNFRIKLVLELPSVYTIEQQQSIEKFFLNSLQFKKKS